MIFSFLSILHVLECISNFLRFWVFFGIVLVKQCLWLLFHFLKFPCHNPGPRVCISHFSHLLYFSTCSRSYSVWVSFSTYFSFFFFFFATFQVLHCAFFIFHVFQCFSRYSMSKSVFVSFFTFFWFLAIFQVLLCAFLIFFHFLLRFLPYFTSYSVCFAFPWFSVFSP